MKEYHKIQTMFKREQQKPNRIIEGQWSLPEFEYLANNKWVFTEKVDGTNIRIMFNGSEITYGGKTDNAQTPMDLIKRLNVLFRDKMELFKAIFPPKDEEPTAVCLYGEGYGAGIQRGGIYKATKDFVLFDVKIGEWWMQRSAVENIAAKLTIDVVPVVGQGTLFDAIEMVKHGLKSRWGDFTAEGIVARPEVELRARSGARMITKIKHRDFFVNSTGGKS